MSHVKLKNMLRLIKTQKGVENNFFLIYIYCKCSDGSVLPDIPSDKVIS